MASEKESKKPFPYGYISIGALLFNALLFLTPLLLPVGHVSRFIIRLTVIEAPIIAIVGLITGIVGIRFGNKFGDRKAKKLSIICVILNSLLFLFSVWYSFIFLWFFEF